MVPLMTDSAFLIDVWQVVLNGPPQMPDDAVETAQRMIKLRLMDAITLLREDDGLNVTLEQ